MSEQVKLTDPEQWSIPFYTPALSNTDRLLLDPIHNEPFHPRRVPTCIKEDEFLYRGLESLASRTGALRVEVAYTRHVEAEDLGSQRWGGWFERRVRSADYFGYEAYGYRKEGPAQYDSLRALTSEALEESNEKATSRTGIDRSGFQNRKIRAIVECGSPTKCFPMDIARVNNSPLERATLEAYDLFFEDFQHFQSFETYAALYGANHIREWIMAARLGIALDERETEKSTRLKVFSNFGRQHQDLTRKIQVATGIIAKHTILGQQPELLAEAEIKRTGVVPYGHYSRFG